MKQEVYLDHSATTPVSDEVLQVMQPYWQTCFANPSSPHRLGLAAQKSLVAARNTLGQLLGVHPEELYFTSGGTEANNAAILGWARAQRSKGQIIVSNIEHSSVLNPCRELQQEGWQVDYARANKDGIISPEQFTSLLEKAKGPALVSVMAVNNEIGSIQDLQTIGEMIFAANSTRSPTAQIAFHCDVVQAIGHIPLQVAKCRIDLMSLSGHKLCAPKGVGLLYCRKNLRLRPLLFGGGHEQGCRPGTENLPAIVGLAEAVRLRMHHFRGNTDRLNHCRQQILNSLQTVPEIVVIGKPESCSPHIVGIALPGVPAEVFMSFLEQEGLYVSIGSACASGAKASHVLAALGLPDSINGSAIRISLSPTMTTKELAYVCRMLPKTAMEVQSIYCC